MYKCSGFLPGASMLHLVSCGRQLPEQVSICFISLSSSNSNKILAKNKTATASPNSLRPNFFGQH
jgi:hypothetical protein